ncbi:MAG: SdrD B-like domain-containing protein, partial [Bacteroidota bacterium]
FTSRDENGVPETRDSDASESNGRTSTFRASRGNQNFTDWDAGFFTPGQVTTYVWNDLNGDGRQNDNETGIEGVEVRLLNANNNVITIPAGEPNAGDDVVATTGPGGVAVLEYAPADIDLKLEFVRPVDHKFTSRDENGVPETRDSDASESNGRTSTFRASQGNQNFTDVDAGLFAPGQVTTYVWNDRNGDGRQNDNEPGVSGVEVRLLNANNQPIVYPTGHTNAGQQVMATTGGNGEALLDYAPADIDIKLEFAKPTDHRFTSRDENGVPDERDSDASESNGRTNVFRATQGSQNFTKWDAGLFVPGTVLTYVWDDRNGDGRQNDNEPGVSGVDVHLLDANNQPIVYPAGHTNAGQQVMATTGGNGEALLDYAPADKDLKLEFDLPEDHRFTGRDENGVPDERDSDASESNGRTSTFRATKGSQEFTKWDAGLWTPGQAVAYVWEDANNDGRQNDNETGIFGMRVNLLEVNNQPVTRPNGSEVFALTECGSFEAVLDYVPANRPVKLEFIPFSNGVFTD